MYGFHKVKSEGRSHEFRHPNFKRGGLEEIKKIKRRVNELIATEDRYGHDCRVLVNEFNKLDKGYYDLSQTLNILSSQNKLVIGKNKELVVQLYFSRKEYELRMKKLIFLFFVLMENYTPELVKLIKFSLANTNLISDNEMNLTTSPNQFKTFIHKIVQRLVFNKNRNDNLLDNLLNLFSNYVNNGDHIDSEVLSSYQTTMDALLKDDKLLPLEYNLDREMSVDENIGAEFLTPLRLGRNESYPDHLNEVGSFLDGLSINMQNNTRTDDFTSRFERLSSEMVDERHLCSQMDLIDLFSPKKTN